MESEMLEKIGLTRNESIVYMTLLRLGTSKTGEILKNSRLNSGKIYEILEGLKVKGLISESIINNVKHFTASPPVQLLDYIEKKKEEIKKDEDAVHSMLPELDKLRKITAKEVKAVTYTGLRGIKTAAEEAFASMKPGEELLGMGITAHKDSKYNELWKRFSRERIDRKILGRHIFSEKSSYFDAFKMMRYTKARILTGITPVAVDVFGEDKVLILNYEEPSSCILIYDRNTATSFRQFFEQLWKISKP